MGSIKGGSAGRAPDKASAGSIHTIDLEKRRLVGEREVGIMTVTALGVFGAALIAPEKPILERNIVNSIAGWYIVLAGLLIAAMLRSHMSLHRRDGEAARTTAAQQANEDARLAMEAAEVRAKARRAHDASVAASLTGIERCRHMIQVEGFSPMFAASFYSVNASVRSDLPNAKAELLKAAITHSKTSLTSVANLSDWIRSKFRFPEDASHVVDTIEALTRRSTSSAEQAHARNVILDKLTEDIVVGVSQTLAANEPLSERLIMEVRRLALYSDGGHRGDSVAQLIARLKALGYIKQ